MLEKKKLDTQSKNNWPNKQSPWKHTIVQNIRAYITWWNHFLNCSYEVFLWQVLLSEIYGLGMWRQKTFFFFFFLINHVTSSLVISTVFLMEIQNFHVLLALLGLSSDQNQVSMVSLTVIPYCSLQQPEKQIKVQRNETNKQNTNKQEQYRAQKHKTRRRKVPLCKWGP